MQTRALSFASVAGLALALPALAQPANNNCSNAISLSGAGNVTGTTAGATADGSASCGSSTGSPDVWYTITLPERKLLIADTCGGANWDTVLSIHQGCPGSPNARQLSCNDDSCNTQSTVQATLEANTPYLIRVAGYSGASGAFTMHVTLQDPPPPPSAGPDVIVGDLQDVGYYTTVSGTASFAVGTTSCNSGDVPVEWIANNNQHPVIAQNIYRLKNGRFEQLGQSWVKHGFSSVNGDLCATCQNPPGGGSQLGVGCSDPYGSGLNGSQGGLGPRSEVNATTGVFQYPYGGRAVQNGLDRRIQVASADIDPAQNAGAVYFIEAQYVTQDDAQWDNGRNNASYRRVRFNNATSSPAFVGGTIRTKSAVWGWKEADSAVEIANADYVDGDISCRFEVGSRVVDNGNGTWTYTYVVRNMNSDRSAGSFTLPHRSGVTYTNVGFRDVPAHSGEPFNGNDWAWSAGDSTAGWATDQTFAQNPNANAIRWGTMYTYWFTANTAPTASQGSIGLFKPGTGASVAVTVPAPAGVACGADYNGDGFLDFFDYSDYVNCFETETCPPGKTADFNNDGFADFFDYADFVTAFETGC